MKVFIEKQEKSMDIKFEGTAKKLLSKLRINPETIIVVKNGEVVSEDEIIKDSDSIKILSVISGG